MDWYRIDGSRISLASSCSKETQEEISKVYDKSQRFRYRVVTLQDWSRCCFCCKHLISDLGLDEDWEHYFCGYFLNNLNWELSRTLYLSAEVDMSKGTCDAYVSEDKDIIDAARIYFDGSDAHRHHPAVYDKATNILRRNGRIM